ncbi:hypothetical protein GCM10025877_27170 [Agromyces mangrovi Wang et al. 2018]|nr:hypothetical protein GCM10025877_27170 [Agromyces mangrovi]
MCLWNRPERVPHLLRELDAQDLPHGIRLVLWNNRGSNAALLRRQLAAFHPMGALRSVETFTSPVNVGGVARFMVVRKLVGDRVAPVVLLDDDQVTEPEFMSTLLADHRPRSIAGVYAWRTESSYWDRSPLDAGDDANYVGTGGCIIDGSIASDPTFFDHLPDRYSFIEDLWMSDRATRLGWTLRKSDAPFAFVADETNQYRSMIGLKDEFHAYLRSQPTH